MPDACGKNTYPNPAAAWRVILTFTKPEHWLKHKNITRPIRAYQCARCHGWHLTHQHAPRKPHPTEPHRAHPSRRIDA